MAKIKVDKGIPMPERNFGKKSLGYVQQALASMDVGDSFVHANTSSAFAAARKLGIKISYRTELRGYRIWRVE